MAAGRDSGSLVIYGVSKDRRGWFYAWLRWPLSSDGTHWSDSSRPFKWWAALRARRMAHHFHRVAGVEVRPANAAEVHAQEVAGADPARWFSTRPYG